MKSFIRNVLSPITLITCSISFIGLSLTWLANSEADRRPKPLKDETTTNQAIKVELLFEKDGCKVYRFNDGNDHYYTDCRGQTMSVLHFGAPVPKAYSEEIQTSK